ncbi:MAG TPA: PIN domain-containing protein [Candidatus Saccharimonadales bacterium]|nr:PIN domain-containing protein [Candidatus Saccharimonadales bacterium]
MIHLDTNYLIGLLVKDSPQVEDVAGWLAAGEPLAASAIAWTEFLNGPVTPLEVSRAEAVLQSRIILAGGRRLCWLLICLTRLGGGAALDLTA